MSIHVEGDRYRVRWRDANGQRSSSFTTRKDAELFEAEIKRSKQLDRAFRRIEVSGPRRPPTRKSTHVYVIVAGDKLKIGIATDPRHRAAQLRTASAVPLVLMRTVCTDKAARIETVLHERYADHRIRREWFDAAPVLTDLMGLSDDVLVALAQGDPNVPNVRPLRASSIAEGNLPANEAV